jgi:hypothetical protein
MKSADAVPRVKSPVKAEASMVVTVVSAVDES